ncbi:aspartate/glutamate racemase family protein [Lactobacillus sp. Sy-1]|uniref:aspartate/glutamate racemase family protein n=1 Tax=Lactobacillus sp. Sy-1 TaxID=2109645 RepID=UPI001C5BC7FA|nr:amino acid racemase [Lactobacillus sp. Sy-1]MBW1606347.1 aspartate/glutamate racemase family protein [Lactobacillus sp. Sy-1]
MKKLGIIGGIGPEATIRYYNDIIKGYQHRLGTTQSLPELTIESINMYHMFKLLDADQLTQVADYVSDAANHLQQAGADFGLMCGNTPHIAFSQIQARTKLPLLSIVDTALAHAKQLHLHRLLLLGTKFTMSNDFFSRPFQDAGIQICLPSQEEQDWLHLKIVKELENGIVNPATKLQLMQMVNHLINDNDLDGVVLGCTELPLIIEPTDLSVATFDIAKIQIEAAVNTILGNDVLH